MSSTDSFAQLIDEKLKELKTTILQEYKNTIDAYFEERKNEFAAFVAANESHKIPNELLESVRAVKNHVTQLKAENMMLQMKVDDLQQYVRRPNLRIFGVPVPVKETADDVKNNSKKWCRITHFFYRPGSQDWKSNNERKKSENPTYYRPFYNV